MPDPEQFKSKSSRSSKKKQNGEEDAYDTHLIKVPILGPLKKILTFDNACVTHNEVVPLPRTPSVSDVLNGFMQHTQFLDEQSVVLIHLLKEYFDFSLGVFLLYRSERTQYKNVLERHPNVPVSDIYGAEHLLRMFVKLPYILNKIEIPQLQLDVLRNVVQELQKYMKRNASNLFTQEYQVED